MATSRSIRCAASTATPRSSPSARERMRCSRWSSLALSALSALAAAAPATAATLATADGERLGLVRADGTGREVHGPAGVLLTNPSWSPDGQRLVVYATHRPGTESERRGLAVVR